MTSHNDGVPGFKTITEEQSGSYLRNYGAHAIGISRDKVTDYYNTWTTYNQDLDPRIYKGPAYIAEFTHKYLKPEDNRRILDVAAGTGRVAVELNKLGFTNIDALEPADQLLKNSPDKHLYKKCIYACLGQGSVTDLADDEYDALVTSGSFGEGHIPCSGLTDMIRVVKPGGFIIIAMREEYLTYVKEYVNRLEPYMKELEDVGKWKRKERAGVEKYSFNKQGLVHVFQVAESGYKPFTSTVLS